LVKIRDDLKIKEQNIVSDIQKGNLNKEYSPKILKCSGRVKILSARLNLDYRIIFTRGKNSWVYYKTIHRKELEKIGKNL